MGAWVLLLAALSSFLAPVTSAPPCQIPGATCSLQANLSTWNHKLSELFPGATRFWGLQDLQPAIAHWGGLYHAHRLLHKLNSGQHIVVAGLGSSFVAEYGGCWQTSLAALRQLGPKAGAPNLVLNPSIYPQPGQLLENSTERMICNKNAGFLTGVMSTINTSWPNFDHVYLNLARGGTSLETLTEGTCLDASIPEQVDLVVLDTVTCPSERFATEKLVRMFLTSKSQPAVLLLSNVQNCPHEHNREATIFGSLFEACSFHCLQMQVQDACTVLESRHPLVYNETENMRLEQRAQPIQELAQHYDIPHLNLHHLVLKGMLPLHRQLGITPWQVLGRLYRDWNHPTSSFYTKGGVGTTMIADAILNWLLEQQQALESMTEGEKAALAYMLPAAVHDKAAVVYQSRCYGVSYTDLIHAAEVSAKKSGDLKEILGASGDYLKGHEFQALPQLQVLTMSGFGMQTYYLGKSGKKLKPGYTTQLPGSFMVFQVSTVFLNAASSVPVEVITSYSGSYDGWGMASISCVEGCMCKAVVVDSHTKEQHSIIKSIAVEVSQHAKCAIRVEVLQETSSGGHKFKVSQVMVRSPLPTST